MSVEVLLSTGKLTVDRSVCIASGQCVMSAPEVFTQDEDEGLVELLTDRIGAAEEEAAVQAARHCPSGAITFEET